MLWEKLVIPIHLRQGIKPNEKGKNKLKIIIGADSETVKGPPETFQFFSGKEDLNIEVLKWTNKKGSFKDFITFCNALPSNDTIYIQYIHNLKFDLISFFYDRLELLTNEEVDFNYENWHIKGVYASTCFLMLYNKTAHKTVYLIDTSAFFFGSLEKLALIFCPELPKLPKPDGLGQIKHSKKDKKFMAYAMRDAEICYYIGKFIDKMHNEYDIQQCVSAPQMAARIFRHKYMKKVIPLPSMKIVYSALHSYHGGKNNITVPMGLYKNVYCLDIVSAYPYAMSLLPSFYEGSLYRTIKGKGHPEKLPQLGVYKIWGEVKNCKWPILFNHAFKPVSGKIDGIWTTGFELNEAIKSKEVIIDKLEGFWYDSAQDKNPSPFKEYVEEFFNLKDTATDPTKRTFYKICLNSLYGKFIQTTRKQSLNDFMFDCDLEKLYYNATMNAGGLFNPFLASLITGHTRAYIHRLEHKYKALHTSTDGIITQIKPKEKDLSNKLGGYKIECEGDALILRNKLYIIYSDKKPDNWEKLSLIEKKKKRSVLIERKYIKKYALHGFHGSVNLLEAMHKKGIYEYEYIKVNKLKESLRRGLAANNFEKRDATLNLKKEDTKNGRKDNLD